jgi:hypothetical protein
MANVKCPQCQKETITFKQKFLTSKWKETYCPNCNARLCANPIVLALLYFMLTWDIVLFGYLTYLENSLTYGITLVVGWFTLEYFMYYIPLSVLKPKPSNSSN